jgi:hypothetical protein
MQPTVQKTAQTSIRIAKAIVTIKQGNTIMFQTNGRTTNQQQIVFNLPNNESDIQFTDSGGIAQIHPEAIPSIQISVQDPHGNTIDTVANITSSKGILLPGTTQKNENIFSFKKGNDFIVQDGKLDIALYPSFKAGDDTIIIHMPGLDPIIIPVKVNP